MNPLTITRNITKLNDREINLGIKEKASWHNEYKDSAWIFVGGLSYDLTEGDIICVFSQYGEIVNINYVRDKKTGKPKGFCFLCYEDQRSTILAVDNFNGIKLSNRIIRVDHVANYRIPKDGEDVDEETQKLREEGCAPSAIKREEHRPEVKKHRPEVNDGSQRQLIDDRTEMRVKTEKRDLGYDKYETTNTSGHRNKLKSSDSMARHHRSQQAQHKYEKDTSSKHKKSHHSSKDGSKSIKRHSESDDEEKSNKYRSKHSKHRH